MKVKVLLHLIIEKAGVWWDRLPEHTTLSAQLPTATVVTDTEKNLMQGRCEHGNEWRDFVGLKDKRKGMEKWSCKWKGWCS